jgi:hypothetical protein
MRDLMTTSFVVKMEVEIDSNLEITEAVLEDNLKMILRNNEMYPIHALSVTAKEY